MKEQVYKDIQLFQLKEDSDAIIKRFETEYNEHTGRFALLESRFASDEMEIAAQRALIETKAESVAIEALAAEQKKYAVRAEFDQL